MDMFGDSRLPENPDLDPQSRIGRSNESFVSLQTEVERQRLMIEVLVRALVEKGLYTREQLNALANLVDMEDGVRDGRRRVKKGLEFCSSCGRTMMNKMGTCLYCGNQEVIDIL